MLGGVEQLTGVCVARSLHETVRKCAAFAADVAVVDGRLPDGSGLDAVKIIKFCCPTALVFLFSNHLEYRPLAATHGFDGFYDKSLEFEALVALLKRLNEQPFGREGE